MNHVVEVTIASEAEIDELAALRTTWHPGDPSADHEFSDVFRQWVEKETNGRVFWIARRDGEPIGMVNLVLFDRMPVPGGESGGWGYLSNMFVVDAERNNGVGAKLIAALTDYGDALGLERIVLKPTERSIPLYTRNGFSADNALLVRPGP